MDAIPTTPPNHGRLPASAFSARTRLRRPCRARVPAPCRRPPPQNWRGCTACRWSAPAARAIGSDRIRAGHVSSHLLFLHAAPETHDTSGSVCRADESRFGAGVGDVRKPAWKTFCGICGWPARSSSRAAHVVAAGVVFAHDHEARAGQLRARAPQQLRLAGQQPLRSLAQHAS